MRILQVTASIADRDGGPSEVAMQLHRQLLQRGHEALLLTTDADGPELRLVRNQIQPADQLNISMHRVHGPRGIKASLGLFLRVLREAKNFQIVYAHGLYLAHNIPVYLANRISGVPYVIQLHGVLEPYQRAQGRAKKKVWDTTIGRAYLKRAAAVICASESERRALHGVVDLEKCHVVPLGAALPAGGEAPSEVTQALSPGRLVVLFLGRLAKKKRPDLLVEAFCRLAPPADALLVVAGPAGDFTAADLRNLAEGFGRSADVLVLGPQYGTAKGALMRLADLFVLPSENENFGISVAEAMLAGAAVLTTPETAAGEHVTRSDGGLVQEVGAEPVGKLTAALAEMLSDETKLRLWGSNGKKYAEDNLTWSEVVRRLTIVLENVSYPLNPR